MSDFQIGRRGLLTTGMLSVGLSALPSVAFAAAPTERRFVFINQRGAADGLGTVMPTGDPAFAGARGALTVSGGTKLDSMFTLHPALNDTAKLYGSKEALFVHAVASRYRDRSHFDGQKMLETGGAEPHQFEHGWLSRFRALIPARSADAIAVSSRAAYHADPQLHGLWERAVVTRAIAGDLGDAGGGNAAATGALAARLLLGPDTRIATIETGGWDTHGQQNLRLAAQLRGLDALIASLKSGLGPQWANTLVLVATEFGRTVAVNGDGGTDHGTGSAAMLIGGGVAGGRVLADWPGLSGANLHEGRDLKPTLGLDMLIAGALAQHYGLDPMHVRAALFPDATGIDLRETLVRA